MVDTLIGHSYEISRFQPIYSIRERCSISLSPNEKMIINIKAISRLHNEHAYKLLDARASNRYLGLEEVIDPFQVIPQQWRAPSHGLSG